MFPNANGLSIFKEVSNECENNTAMHENSMQVTNQVNANINHQMAKKKKHPEKPWQAIKRLWPIMSLA